MQSVVWSLWIGTKEGCVQGPRGGLPPRVEQEHRRESYAVAHGPPSEAGPSQYGDRGMSMHNDYPEDNRRPSDDGRRRVHVWGLPPSVGFDELKDLFGRYGTPYFAVATERRRS